MKEFLANCVRQRGNEDAERCHFRRKEHERQSVARALPHQYFATENVGHDSTY